MWMRWALRYSPTLLAFILLGCSLDRGTRHLFKVEEIDGVLIAENTGGPKYSEELFQYEEILTLKQDTGEPESLLNSPESFLIDEHGYFYVEDNGNNRIAVFDPSGYYVRSFGREGSGPGEFQWMSLQNLEGDVLSVYDIILTRTSYYRTDGTLLRDLRVPGPSQYLYGFYLSPRKIPSALICNELHVFCLFCFKSYLTS